jgi:hypothetical protein
MFSKKLIITMAAFCLPFMAGAQVGAAVNSVSPVKVHLGLKVGANFQRLQGDTWSEASKTGYVGGIFGGAYFKKFGVSGEVLFGQTSFTTTGTKLNNARKAAAATNYTMLDSSAKEGAFAVTTVSVPVLFNVKVLKIVWLQIGPQYSAVINVKDKDGLVKDADNLFKSGDISGVLGAQVNILSKLNIGARYIMGFSDVNGTSNSASETWRNRGAQVHIGYSFL